MEHINNSSALLSIMGEREPILLVTVVGYELCTGSVELM